MRSSWRIYSNAYSVDNGHKIAIRQVKTLPSPSSLSAKSRFPVRWNNVKPVSGRRKTQVKAIAEVKSTSISSKRFLFLSGRCKTGIKAPPTIGSTTGRTRYPLLIPYLLSRLQQFSARIPKRFLGTCQRPLPPL